MTKNQKLEELTCELLLAEKMLLSTAIGFMEAGKEYEIKCCGGDFHSFVNGTLYRISKCRLDDHNTLEFYTTSVQKGLLYKSWLNHFAFGDEVFTIIQFINFPD